MKIKEWIDKVDPGSAVILFSCELELNLLDLETDEEREKYLKENNVLRYFEINHHFPLAEATTADCFLNLSLIP